ncbi:MAG: MFS transporter [Alphaproteobacteria bacterium]|nr:MFS transporter [Alphaproteobacteria bacterium]
MAKIDTPLIPIKTQLAVYGCGMFANSMSVISGIIIPLWVSTFEKSAILLGVVFSARHVLPLILSIHGGALMDRLGTRRVMLIFAVINAAVPLIFPTMPLIWAAIFLQMLAGLATSMGWMGAQTLIGQVMKGSAVYAGRLSFSLRLGHLIGPPMIGVAWDLGGSWVAFTVMSIWASFGFFSAMALPSPDAKSHQVENVTFSGLLPRMADYVTAFRMLAISAVLFVVIATMLRNAGNVVQTGFYVVYLDNVVGLSGTLIGILTSVAAVVGGIGSLSVGQLLRFCSAHWLLLATVAGSVIFVCATPLLGAFTFLVIASAMRGASLGVSQPLMISILAKASGSKVQGTSVGLRNTANRLAGVIVPFIMGVLIQLFGLANGFYAIGMIVLAMLIATGIWLRKQPEITNARN